MRCALAQRTQEFHTLLCHCLLHGWRQFVDVVENFPEECRKVIESLREVYRFDALAKEQRRSVRGPGWLFIKRTASR